MEKGRVFSYLRFSDPKQAAGSSAARQTEYAKRWAAERGLHLDTTLSLKDEGLSAFHQAHVKNGALGVFLRAIEDGLIPVGSVLVVEGLDRLSRAAPILAQAQLAQIITAGITVVTASDGREYNFERLKKEPMDLVYSLLVMIRAHEESDTKAKRVKAAIRKQAEGWLAGSYRGTVGAASNDPAWIQRTAESGYALHPERSFAIRTMIDLFRDGYGAVRIMETLAERGLAFSDKRSNNPDRVGQILRMRALIGEKPITVDGEVYRLSGYYPALLSETEFAELQYLISQRGRRKGKGEVPALFTGLRIAFCGYCGHPLVSQNGMNKKRREDGLPQDGHRRLVCTGYKATPKCSVGGSCSVVPIERAIMAFCSDQMNLSRLVGGDTGAVARSARLAQARSEAAATEGQISKIMDAMLADPDAMPAAFARKVRELEDRLKAEREAVEKLEHEVAVTNTAAPASAQAWAYLVEGVEALDYDARMKARALVADSFTRISVFNKGFTPKVERDTIGLLLVGKNGNTRVLRVDRHTGSWHSSEDVDYASGLPLPPSLEPA
jgi:DNA invertase Pin-like site-specific DNA recombinase